MHVGRSGTGELDNQLGQLQHGVLIGVPNVYRTGEVRVQQGQEPANLIVDEAQAPRLVAVPVHGERVTPLRLDDEVRYHPTVTRPQAGTIGIEDTGDADVGPQRAVVGHGDRLGEALGLVVHAPGAHRVHVPPVRLGLGMYGRVAVDLAGGGQDE